LKISAGLAPLGLEGEVIKKRFCTMKHGFYTGVKKLFSRAKKELSRNQRKRTCVGNGGAALTASQRGAPRGPDFGRFSE